MLSSLYVTCYKRKVICLAVSVVRIIEMLQNFASIAEVVWVLVQNFSLL
jgi:hypothetical protein